MKMAGGTLEGNYLVFHDVVIASECCTGKSCGSLF